MIGSGAANTDSFKATTPSDREIVLTRLFDAPRALVFEAMTKPEHVRRWWGILDEHHSVTVCEIDLRPGGAWRFTGRGPRGDYGFHGVYREIAAPERLVFTYNTEGGGIEDPETLVTVTFADLGPRTGLTLHQSAFESDVALNSHEGGWTGCLERFSAFVIQS